MESEFGNQCKAKLKQAAYDGVECIISTLEASGKLKADRERVRMEALLFLDYYLVVAGIFSPELYEIEASYLNSVVETDVTNMMIKVLVRMKFSWDSLYEYLGDRYREYSTGNRIRIFAENTGYAEPGKGPLRSRLKNARYARIVQPALESGIKIMQDAFKDLGFTWNEHIHFLPSSLAKIRFSMNIRQKGGKTTPLKESECKMQCLAVLSEAIFEAADYAAEQIVLRCLIDVKWDTVRTETFVLLHYMIGRTEIYSPDMFMGEKHALRHELLAMIEHAVSIMGKDGRIHYPALAGFFRQRYTGYDNRYALLEYEKNLGFPDLNVKVQFALVPFGAKGELVQVRTEQIIDAAIIESIQILDRAYESCKFYLNKVNILNAHRKWKIDTLLAEAASTRKFRRARGRMKKALQ
ncbi:MAG: hypothetical protein JW874_10575 [Spirochaetales bacterium]|nr:hypothetical protein [Spirochaetales bacterium]